jgi:hypothetical protein
VRSEAPVWATAYPSLSEYVSSAVWEDGTPRETSTLLMFFEEGLFKMCLTDRALQRSLWSSGEEPADCWATLEVLLTEGRGEWRKSKGYGNKGARRA